MRGSVLIAYEEGKQNFGSPLYEIKINGTDTRDYQWSEANSLYSTYIFSGNTLSASVLSAGYGQIPYINIFLTEYTNDDVSGDGGLKTTQLTGVTGNNQFGYLNVNNIPINPSANCYDFIVTVSAGVTQGCAPFGTLTGITGSGLLYTTTSEIKTKNVGVTQQDDGEVYVGVYSQFTNTGYFGPVGSTSQVGPVLRLDKTYAQPDSSFNSKAALGTSIIVNDIELQNDGMVLVGNGITGTSGNCLSRLTINGSLDATFTRYTFTGSTGNDLVSDVVQQSDGKIIVSGRFTSVNGSTYNSYARFNYNGTIDNTYYSGGTGTGFSNLVNCEIDNQDRTYFFGNKLFTFNGSEFGCILRLNTNGQLDTTFNGTGRGGFSRVAGPTCIVNSILIQSDGKILCVGGFTSYNGEYVRGVARLNEDGTLDTTFNPGGYGLLGGSILEVFPTETINEDENAYLIVGAWTGASYNEVAIPNGIFFINKDGSLGNNTNLGTGIIGEPKTAKLLPNGSYLITGQITSFNGTPITNGGFIQISSTGQLQNC